RPPPASTPPKMGARRISDDPLAHGVRRRRTRRCVEKGVQHVRLAENPSRARIGGQQPASGLALRFGPASQVGAIGVSQMLKTFQIHRRHLQPLISPSPSRRPAARDPPAPPATPAARVTTGFPAPPR